MKRCTGLLILIFFFASCGGGGGSDSTCGALGVKVFGGDQCNFSRSPVVSIVAFGALGKILGNCSGTLITLDDVLTAGHCAELTAIPGFAGAFVFVDEEAVLINRFSPHPFYDGSTVSPFDVAVISLEKPVNIGPVPLLLSDSLAIGEPITIFGYGKNEQNDTGVPNASDFKAGEMKVSDLNEQLFVAEFNTTGSAICQGDSGGPATQTINGVTSVVGVISFNVNGCASNSLSGFVNVQNPLIYEFIGSIAPDAAVR